MSQELLRQNLEVAICAGKAGATFTAHPDGQWVHITDLERWLKSQPGQVGAVSEDDRKPIGKAMDNRYWFIPADDGDLIPIRCGISSMTEQPLSNSEKLIGRLCERINRLAAAMAGGDGWVKCSERMPEPTFDVLVHGRDGVILVACLKSDGSWEQNTNWVSGRGDDFDDGVYENGFVTHWRPLPPPPSAGEASR